MSGHNISHYYLYDALESNDDLTALFEIFFQFKDKNGNHPVFTAINVVANPEIGKIQIEGFNQFYYEPFTETFKRYPHHIKVYDLWKEGADKNYLFLSSLGTST